MGKPPDLRAHEYAEYLARSGADPEMVEKIRGAKMTEVPMASLGPDDIIETTDASGKKIFVKAKDYNPNTMSRQQKIGIVPTWPSVSYGPKDPATEVQRQHGEVLANGLLAHHEEYIRGHVAKYPGLGTTPLNVGSNLSGIARSIPGPVKARTISPNAKHVINQITQSMLGPIPPIYKPIEKRVDPERHDRLMDGYRRAMEAHELPAKPVNRDALIAAVDSVFLMPDSICAPDQVGPTTEAIKRVVRDGEWFDFGNVSGDVFGSAFKDSQPFYEEGLLNLPFPDTIFRARLCFSEEDVRGDVPYSAEVVLVCHQDEVNAPLSFYMLSIRGAGAEYAQVVEGTHIEGPEAEPITVGSIKDNPAGRAAGIPILRGLWMILNTRNITKLVTEPEAKLNKARAKNNKPPLKRVTRIDTDQYMTALRMTEQKERTEHQGGTHKSPKPHLRRGHIRHYRDEAGEVRKKVNIWPMIVNGSDALKVAKRMAYKVLPPKEQE